MNIKYSSSFQTISAYTYLFANKKYMLFIFSLIFFFSKLTFAGDVLFIDINNAMSEIQVVQDSLKNEPHTQLVIVPSLNTFSWEQRKKQEDLYKELGDISKGHLNNEAFKRIYNIGLEIRMNQSGDPTQEYTKEDLYTELQETLSNPQYHFDRVFISGHHSLSVESVKGVLGGEFINGFDTLKVADMLNQANSLKNVYFLSLLGCNTGTKVMMSTNESPWARVLPQAILKVGFNSRAPIKTDASNLAILKDVIKVQKYLGKQISSNTPIDLNSVHTRMTLIPTRGRHLGFRLDDQYFQSPRD